MESIDQRFASSLFSFYKDLLSRIRSLRLTQLVKGVSHEPVIPMATYAPWLDDAQFGSIYDKIKGSTLVDQYRCFELWSLVRQTARLGGAILEVGVWKGGTGTLMTAASSQFSAGKVYLADTFQGVVKASHLDPKYKGGEHSDTSVEEVTSLLKSAEVTNYELLTGIFPDQVSLPEGTALKLCHIDVDTFQSANDIFWSVWPLMVKGGVVVFDDYGFWGCEGVTSFCNSIAVPDGFLIHNLNGHALLIKL